MATSAYVVVPLLVLSALLYAYWLVLCGQAMDQGTDGSSKKFIFVSYRCMSGSVVNFASIMMIPGMAGGKDLRITPRLQDLTRLSLSGVFLCIVSLGNVLALDNVPSITVSMFQTMLPVVSFVACAALRMEDVSWLKVLGVAAASGGAVIVVMSGKKGTGTTSVNYSAGLPLCMAGLLAQAFFHVNNKPLTKIYPPSFLMGFSYFIAAIPAVIMGLSIDGPASPSWALDHRWLAWGAIAYGTFGIAFAYYGIVTWGIRESTPTLVTSFQCLQPVFAAMLCYFIKGEVITWGEVIGGVIIIAGLFLYIIGKQRLERQAAEKEKLKSEKEPDPKISNMETGSQRMSVEEAVEARGEGNRLLTQNMSYNSTGK